MTDWYLGHEIGDLIVPKDQVYFDRLPSPDSWSHWGISEFGNSGSWQNNSDDDASKIVNQQTYSNLGGSNARGCPDMQFSNLTGSDSMDDMFLSSLIHDDRNPVGCPPQSRYNVEPAHSDLADRMLDFQSISSDTDGVGSSNYIRTPPFSPSAVSDNGHYSGVHNSYGKSSCQNHSQSVKELDTMEMLLSDQEPECEDSSIEESVLLGLEAALNKLSCNTRLCFRDSLYRLALRSEPQMSEEISEECLPFDRPPLLETADAQTRCAGTVTAESETNTIDRAVANLMFHMMDADVVDLLPSILAKFNNRDNAFGAIRACNYGLFQAESFPCPKPAKSSADSEVPEWN